MRRSIVDEREHRRGLVLGLTLAEILLLLLFLVLLALAGRVFQLKKNAEKQEKQLGEIHRTLGPIMEKFNQTGEVDLAAIRKLTERLSRIADLERGNEALRAENSDIKSKLAALQKLGPKGEKILSEIAPLLERVSRIRPNDPPAALSRAVDLLENAPASIKPEDLKSLSDLGDVTGKLKDLQDRVVVTESERDRFRRERDNLMRSKGGGLQYPSCWTNDKGETEYIFDITFRDGGLLVRDHAQETRKSDPAWTFVNDFRRDVEINESVFVSATSRLFQWSKENECRFVVIVRDQTGENKSRFKTLMSSVERHFYKNEIIARRSVNRPGNTTNPLPPTRIMPSEPSETALPPHHIGGRQEVTP
jgi:hypothetical protein